ncbi:glycosyltransferase [Nonlabens antarcticus]|uniref:glycosyltransferase n=1 Tax=Nonlabens antarcticus TaxID=392714 RepID=UPI0018913DC8|nr:glycosyltransferase family A protein [Nonlabens antarcticus]
MQIAIIIPAFNEEALISQTLESLCAQSHQPTQIIVVDDNSTDATFQVAQSFSNRLPISVIHNDSSAENIPGAKVINAFKKGLETLDLNDFDIICKYDSDLVFPVDYLEAIVVRFRESEKTGMVAGHCTVQKNGEWTLENQNNPDHIRGALKAYRVACFREIGGLKSSIGWDTMDEMLARYYGWKVVTIPDLHVKHLKPTGASYKPNSMKLQGEAFFKMRYGIVLTSITALKMAAKKKEWQLLKDYLSGYFKAQKNGVEPLLNKDQGRFLRSYRWKGIRSKLGF